MLASNLYSYIISFFYLSPSENTLSCCLDHYSIQEIWLPLEDKGSANLGIRFKIIVMYFYVKDQEKQSATLLEQSALLWYNTNLFTSKHFRHKIQSFHCT